MIAKCLLLSALFLSSEAALAHGLPLESGSLEWGSGAKVDMLKLALESHWDRQWLSSGGKHVSGYWDISLARWQGNAYRGVAGQHQNIVVVGLTPTFRYQCDDHRGWYGELGVGANLLSARYDNNGHQLSTAFEFGDHIGLGYVFANGWEAGVKLQHFSNGGIKQPNSGVNFAVVKLTRPF